MPSSFRLRDPIPQQIQANGQDVFEVFMFNWGVNVDDTYPEYRRFDDTIINTPNFPFTPQAISIGPRSTVDRCWVSWNYQTTNVGSQTMTRTLSLDTPLLFAQTAGAGAVQPAAFPPLPLVQWAMAQNLLYVGAHNWPRDSIDENGNPGAGLQEGYMSTLLPEHYLDAAGGLQTFYLQDGNARVMPPCLHLQFHLKAPIVSPNTKRAPFMNGFRLGSVAAPGVEELIYGWPAFGRKTIAMQVSATQPVTFRVAALRNINRFYRIQETTEGQLESTASDESIRFRFCDLAADYVLLYITRGAGAAPTVNGTIVMYD